MRKGTRRAGNKYNARKVEFHGQSKTKLYRIWADMLQRCNNPKSTNYKYYGEKGIKVCEEWHVFSTFKDWSDGNGYKEGLSIDRIDVHGNYEPTNCRWVDRVIQDNNRSDTIWVDINGERMSLKQLADKHNLSYSMLQHRYNVGDRGEKLLDEPKRGVKRKGQKNIAKYSKLNDQIVSEVKWLSNNTKLFQREIGEIYNISQTMVGKLKKGVFHKDVKEKKPKWWSER